MFYYLTFYDGAFPFEQVYDFCEFDKNGEINYAEFEYCFCYTNDAEIEQYFADQDSQGHTDTYDDTTGDNDGSGDGEPVDGDGDDG